jgi:peptidase YpeB-like protein
MNGSAGRSVEGRMKITRKLLMGSMSVIGLGLSATAREPSQAQLVQKAKITKSEAEHIALAKVPNGRVKSAEIENEKGHLVWSFDIARSNVRDITEILVDTKTGKIISIQIESATDQAKEAVADRKK